MIDGVDVSPLTWTQLVRVKDSFSVLSTFISDCIERSVSYIPFSIAYTKRWAIALASCSRRVSYHD